MSPQVIPIHSPSLPPPLPLPPLIPASYSSPLMPFPVQLSSVAVRQKLTHKDFIHPPPMPLQPPPPPKISNIAQYGPTILPNPVYSPIPAYPSFPAFSPPYFNPGIKNFV